MGKPHDYDWLRRCSPEDLSRLEEGVGNPFSESWLTTAASVYLLLIPVVLLAALIVRAVERSSPLEIIAWLIFAVPCIPAFLAHRRQAERRELWFALKAEAGRRSGHRQEKTGRTWRPKAQAAVNGLPSATQSP